MSKQKLIPPPPSIDLLIHSLKHHAPDNLDPETYAVCKNPFEEIDVSEELSKGQKVLDFDSEPDSEAEDTLYSSPWQDADQESADVQSMDHEMEYSEIIERAGVYTADEILKTSIEKATKLHSLYCNQLNQLRQIYIERKRQYLQELKKEKELFCSIHSQKKTSLEEMKKYKQLKAFMSYGRKHGLDITLAKREQEKRLASRSKLSKAQKVYKCCFQDDGVRCLNVCVPLTKFCTRHILMDKRQVLFRACGAPFNNTTCNNPVLVVSNDEHCVYHTTYKSVWEREKAAQEALDKARRKEMGEEIIKEEEDIKEEIQVDERTNEDQDMKEKIKVKETAHEEKVNVLKVDAEMKREISEGRESKMENEKQKKGDEDVSINFEEEILEEREVVEEQLEYEEEEVVEESIVQVEESIVQVEESIVQVD